MSQDFTESKKTRFISPGLSSLNQLRTPLNAGEHKVLEFFNKNLDIEWEIYIQPPLNGLRPDFVLLHPRRGIAVFEVKDWDPQKIDYQYNKERRAIIGKDKFGKTFKHKQQPIAQLINYKEEIFSMYCPSLTSKMHFGLVTIGLIFPKFKTADLNKLFPKDTQFPSKFRPNKTYNKNGIVYTEGYKQNTITGEDELTHCEINKVFPNAEYDNHLMIENIYYELKAYLRETEFDREQRIDLILNNKQKDIQNNRPYVKLRRVRGAAGSGKSIALCGRATNLIREKKKILIVTFNITLINYLGDLISRYGCNRNSATILHYHGLARRIFFEAGLEKEWAALFPKGSSNIDKNDMLFRTKIPLLLDKIIPTLDEETRLKHDYDAILVDEGQDFSISWWNNLKSLLKTDGEMLLISDPTQDLYDSARAWTSEAMTGAGFSGQWVTLNTCYRMPRKLQVSTNEFARNFLPNRPDKVLTFPMAQQDFFEHNCHLEWIHTNSDLLEQRTVQEILKLPEKTKNLGLQFTYADTVFLTATMKAGLNIVNALERINFNVHHIFVEKDKGNSKGKKMHFYKGAPQIKGATYHSFKGLETRCLILQISKPKGDTDKHAIYAALTRLKTNDNGCLLIVISDWQEAKEFGEGLSSQRKLHIIPSNAS